MNEPMSHAPRPMPLTVWHLVKHDVRSQRLVLLACAVFSVADAWLATTVLPYEVMRVMGTRAGSVLSGVRVLLLVLATGFVLQQDALVGTTAFWRTRPIGRHVLLASKATTLGLLLILWPAIVQWVAWYRLGVYAGDASLVAGAVAVDNATVVLLAAMAAVVTPSFTYLVVAGVAGGTMVTVLNGYVLPVLMTSWPFVGQTLQGYRPALYLGTLFLLGVPAVAYQFLRMKDWHTAALVGVALLAATLVTRFWPTDGERAAYPPVDHRIIDPQSVTVVMGEQTGRWEGAPRRSPAARINDGRSVSQEAWYSVPLVSEGQPVGMKFWVHRIESRLLLRDRTVVTRVTNGGQVLPADLTPTTHPNYRTVQAAVWPARLSEPIGQRFNPLLAGTTIARVPLDIDQANASARALLTADVDLLATRTRVVATAPARAGARLRGPRWAVEIVSVSADGRQIRVRLRRLGVAGVTGSDVLRWGQWNLLLRNTSRGEAVAFSDLRGSRTFSSALGITSLRATVNESTYVYTAQPGWTLDAAWLSGADVLATEDEALGTFTRSAQTTLRLGAQ